VYSGGVAQTKPQCRGKFREFRNAVLKAEGDNFLRPSIRYPIFECLNAYGMLADLHRCAGGPGPKRMSRHDLHCSPATEMLTVTIGSYQKRFKAVWDAVR
jgi:hypothetical protein